MGESDASVATIASTGPLTAVVSGRAAGTTYLAAMFGTAADSARIEVTSSDMSGRCVGTTVVPGTDVQALVATAAVGTTFCLEAGTYHRQSIAPKRKMSFIGEPCQSAVLDGDSVTPYAFYTSDTAPADSVTIKCLDIQRYVPPIQMGAIKGGSHSIASGGREWTVDSNVVHHNANLGIRLGNRWRLRWNYVHHNGVLGIGGVTDTTEVRGNEISHNNYLGLGKMDVEAGGTKFVLSHHLRLVGNFVHHNTGVGLWLDIDNDQTTIDSNTVEDNVREGIVSEISYSASIHDNTVSRNGLLDDRRLAWPWGAGIGIHASGGTGIDVYGNTLTGNAHGIALIQQSRGSGAMGPHYVQHVAVHDNTVTCGTGSLSVAAAVVDAGDNAIFAGRGVSFRANTYTELSKCSATTPRGSVGTGGFAWRNGWRTSSQWQAFGLDSGGTFLP